jgi:hypothetical protein
MLFYQNLDNIIFTRNQLFNCDELVIISGYVGPHPIERLKTLPIKSTVIYGMYGCDGIQRGLHNTLLEENKNLPDTDIFYSTIPVHSKIYMWKKNGEVVHALVGSANFSVNGLTTPFKEVLAETTYDTFDALNQYSKMILDKAITCDEAQVSENKKKKRVETQDYTVYDPEVCSMPLYIIENEKKTVPLQSGINWGRAKLTGSHVNINDAYIRIGAELLEYYPALFPPKQESPVEDVGKKGHRHNDNIEIIWDDGTSMIGLLEGSITKEINGKREKYPKQISTTPSKAELGKYIRKRLGKKDGELITIEDLQKYGRTSIDVSIQGEGVYYFDFSPNSQEETR